MDVTVDEKELNAAGADPLDGGRTGLRILGWEIETRKRSILNSSSLQLWEKQLGTTHLPEMVFGDSSLTLRHLESSVIIHFNAFDALSGWKQEALPPVEVPAAAKWKFRSKPMKEVILDYDYTFTTPYVGSENIELNTSLEERTSPKAAGELFWEDCNERIDLAALAVKEPILFYDEIVIYEDELADNGVSLLTVKVLRVDGVLIRLRDTRMYCRFEDTSRPIVLRESCWREATFKALSSQGHPVDSSSYSDPSIISQRLPVIMHKTQKLVISGKAWDRLVKVFSSRCLPMKRGFLRRNLLPSMPNFSSCFGIFQNIAGVKEQYRWVHRSVRVIDKLSLKPTVSAATLQEAQVVSSW